MAISQKLKNALKVAIVEPGAIKEIVTLLGGESSEPGSSPSTKQTDIAVTYTAGNPSFVANQAITIAAGGTPTVVELLEYCNELRAQVVALNAILLAQGLTH